jgi:formate dehydrogenase iron-sulfur subunit
MNRIGFPGKPGKRAIMNRRMFLKTMGVTGGSALTARTFGVAEAAGNDIPVGVLVDETRCVGCRKCESACAESHGLPGPLPSGETIFDKHRTPTESQLTVVNRYKTTADEFYARKQCMHCAQPACVTACLTRAMHKTQEGAVVWDENKCMGCRYCMIACPFDIPKFEYHKAIPKIRKCDLCWDRIQAGKQPACVEICPSEAMLFGKRSDLIETARKRIYERPDEYSHSLYGEHEVGGTGWIYISPVPMENLGFETNLGTTPYPEYTKQFLYSVPVILLLWPAMLLALGKATESE